MTIVTARLSAGGRVTVIGAAASLATVRVVLVFWTATSTTVPASGATAEIVACIVRFTGAGCCTVIKVGGAIIIILW